MFRVSCTFTIACAQALCEARKLTLAVYDNTYSRFVAWGKIALPLMALGLLSTMFLLSRDTDPSLAIPFADIDVNELTKEQRISAPNYAGVTEDGSAISVEASSARPDQTDPNVLHALALEAEIETRAGQVIQLSSVKGEIDTKLSLAKLAGGVVVRTSTGYQIETEAMQAALNTTNISSDLPVTLTGPGTELQAGSMKVTQTEEDGLQLIFQNGVRLVYTPQNN